MTSKESETVETADARVIPPEKSNWKVSQLILPLSIVLGGLLGWHYRFVIRGIYDGKAILVDQQPSVNVDENQKSLRVLNIHFQTVKVVGVRASCSCLTNQSFPLELRPFRSETITFDAPPRGAIVEFYVDCPSSRIIWGFEE